MPGVGVQQGQGQKGRDLSRKAQLINCWLVSREVDGGSTRVDKGQQSMFVFFPNSPLLSDNIIKSFSPLSLLYPITIGITQKISFGSYLRSNA